MNHMSRSVVSPGQGQRMPARHKVFVHTLGSDTILSNELSRGIYFKIQVNHVLFRITSLETRDKGLVLVL